jgi:tetratricopeptide (TPR) repeat protein
VVTGVQTCALPISYALDYPFTGLGFGRFGMAFSSYMLFLPSEYILHAHNLFLDVWLQQGILGLLALGWLFGLAGRPQPGPSPWRSAALAALGILVLHGLVDDAFYALGSGAGTLLFVPFALLARSEVSPAPIVNGSPVRKRSGVILAGVLAVVMVGLAFIPGIQATFVANLGALAQTQIELSTYPGPEWSVQDEVRRSPQVDLRPAIQYYEMTLALDPANVTANRRLGQIELSRGQYEAACRHLEAAYQAAPWQEPSGQLAGECYAISGEIQRAADVWRATGEDNLQFGHRQWWYEHLGEQQRADWMQQAWDLMRSMAKARV